MRRLLVLAFVLTACASPALPPGSGEGLTAFDREAPAGAETFARPQWTAGDRFVLRRGDQLTMAFRAQEAADGGWVLVDERSGLHRWLTADLALQRSGFPEDPTTLRVRDPQDTQLCWPLWVGKRWTVHLLRKAPGAAMPVRADYRCDAIETIATPAGEFRCLRIWRRAQPVVPDATFLANVEIGWYSPDAGWFARYLEDGIVDELVEVHRQRP
jgi:hypothetical protein